MSKKIEGLINTLNDSCFVYGSEALTELCQMIECESGTKPTLANLCDILAVSLQCCGRDLLSDVNVQAVEKLTPRVSLQKKMTLRPGDILAVPRVAGGCYFVIYIVSNQFGDAFGIFEGYNQVPLLVSNWNPMPFKCPVYTGKMLILSGHWRRITNREDLLKLFPGSPEVFHSKSDNSANPLVGSFGSGETATGELRELAEHEAMQLGLIQGTYRQIMTENEFERYLHAVLG